MKKFLAVVLVLAILGACGYAAYSYFDARPLYNDFETAKANLENAGYVVLFDEDGNDLYVRQLSAKGEDDNAIDIVEFKDEELAEIYYNYVKTSIKAEKDMCKVEIEGLKYNLEHEEDLTDDKIERYNKQIQEYEEELELFEKMVCGRSGAIVWMGTKDAAKASRG